MKTLHRHFHVTCMRRALTDTVRFSYFLVAPAVCPICLLCLRTLTFMKAYQSAMSSKSDNRRIFESTRANCRRSAWAIACNSKTALAPGRAAAQLATADLVGCRTTSQRTATTAVFCVDADFSDALTVDQSVVPQIQFEHHLLLLRRHPAGQPD